MIGVRPGPECALDTVRDEETPNDQAALNFVVIFAKCRTRGKGKSPQNISSFSHTFPLLRHTQSSSTNSKAQVSNPKTTPIRTQVTRSIFNKCLDCTELFGKGTPPLFVRSYLYLTTKQTRYPIASGFLRATVH